MDTPDSSPHDDALVEWLHAEGWSIVSPDPAIRSYGVGQGSTRRRGYLAWRIGQAGRVRLVGAPDVPLLAEMIAFQNTIASLPPTSINPD